MFIKNRRFSTEFEEFDSYQNLCIIESSVLLNRLLHILTVSCHCMKASTKNELMSENRENIIQNYIEGYNKFDVEKMLLDLDNEIIFQNIQNGEINLTLNGINEFKDQAEKSKLYFEKRQQKITSIKHTEDKTEIEIDYFAVLRIDFPNGLKKGQKLELKGKTIFTFKNNKIISISDIS